MALELLIEITPFAAGNAILGMRLVPHAMENFVNVSGTNAVVAIIPDESLNFMAVAGGFLHGLGRWLDVYEVQAFHFRRMCEAAGTERPGQVRAGGRDASTSMNNLAGVLRDQSKYKEAEEMHQQALQLMETALGKEHPGTLTSMNNLATVLRIRYEQAEEMLQQALRPSETVPGKEHPDTDEHEKTLALVLDDQGKYELAEEMHQQVLRLSEIMLGKEHPDTLTVLYNLAYMLSNQKRFSEANALYQRR